MQKRGSINAIIYIVLALFLLLIVGMGVAFGVMVTDWTFDEAVPELSNLGMVGNANLTQTANFTLVPLDNLVQQFTWLGGLVYLFGLMGCLLLAVAFRFTGNKWLAGLFIVCMLMLVITCIFVSNIYEDFYNDGGDVGTRLHEQQLLSFMILQSPMIMCLVGFISGIIMFTGEVPDGGL